MEGPPGRAQPEATAQGPASGTAADAIADAEVALAQQNSAISQLDMQVVSAILNAHLTTVEGRDALTALQQETESAVRTRSDLDTPAGARDFQRFLVGKLRDIRAVVLNASLDDTSKSALMAAWTSLYGAAGRMATGGDDPPAADASDDADTDWDPLSDALSADEPGAPDSPPPEPGPAGGIAAAPPVAAPAIPEVPAFGAGPLSGMGAPFDWALPARGQWGGEPDAALRNLAGEAVPEPAEPDPGDDAAPPAHDAEGPDPAEAPQAPGSGPTPVTLPDGEVVTAANPRLAAAITAAVAGTPIAEAFQRQGITLPAPGTAVADPLDPRDVAPGDIGMFTDRHALALGPDKALLDGQIQHLATVSGPDFLGWEHPPSAAAAAPTGPVTPAPTRPAANLTPETTIANSELAGTVGGP